MKFIRFIRLLKLPWDDLKYIFRPIAVWYNIFIVIMFEIFKQSNIYRYIITLLTSMTGLPDNIFFHFLLFILFADFIYFSSYVYFEDVFSQNKSTKSNKITKITKKRRRK